MITDPGKVAILRSIAGLVPQIAGSMALGVGTTAPVGTDLSLNYEVVRIPLSSINPNIDDQQIVFRATLQPGQISTVYEVGLYVDSAIINQNVTLPLPGNVAARWTNATFVTTNARASATNAKVDVAANGTISAELTGMAADLSKFTEFDSVVIGYTASSNVSSVKFRMGTDSSNYYEFSISAPTAGYKIYRATLGSATKVGTPTWSLLNYFAVRPSATSGGAASIYFDGVRFEKSTPGDQNVLVARSVLVTPQLINASIPTDIEYGISVAVTA